MKKLTIAIPTYNRKEAILSKLNELSEYILKHNLEKKIELLIIDNNSIHYNVFDLLENYLKMEFVTVKKNITNIGAAANFLKCLELANGEYVWLLGDDENYSTDKILNLYGLLTKQDVYLLSVNEVYHQDCGYFGVFKTEPELLNKLYIISSLFVLSRFIFKKKSALKFLNRAYQANTFQHPYVNLAVEMLHHNYIIELLNIDILKLPIKRSSLGYSQIVGDIDALYSGYEAFDDKKRFVELDLNYRSKTIFNWNLGITNKVDLDDYRYQLSRLGLLLSGNVKYRTYIRAFKFYIFLRRSISLFSAFVFLHSILRDSRFKNQSFSEVKSYLANNLNYKNRRH